MSYFVRTAFALLAFTGMVGVASAATYSWPLAISVPVTVSYPNPPPGFTVVLHCNFNNPDSGRVLGEVTANVPFAVVSGVASYHRTMLVYMRSNSAPPVTGGTMLCQLTTGGITGKNGVYYFPESSGQRSDRLTLP